MDQTLRLQAEVQDKFSAPLKRLQDRLREVKSPEHLKELGEKFEGAHKAAEKLGEAMKTTLEPALAGVGLASLSLGGALAGIARAAQTFGEGTVSLNRLGKETGLTVDRLRQLEAVGSRLKIGTGETDAGLKTFAQNLHDLRLGVGDTAGFLRDRLPELYAQLSKSGSTDDALSKALGYLTKIPEATERARVAGKLFGSDTFGRFGEMGLDKLREALDEVAKNQGKLGKGGVDSALQYEDAINNLRERLLGLRDSIGSEVLPVMTQLVDKVGDFFEKNKDDIKGGIVGFIHKAEEFDWQGTITKIGHIADVAERLAGKMGGWSNALLGLGALAVAPRIITTASAIFTISRSIWAVNAAIGAFAFAKLGGLLDRLTTFKAPKLSDEPAPEPKSSVTGRKPTGPTPAKVGESVERAGSSVTGRKPTGPATNDNVKPVEVANDNAADVRERISEATRKLTESAETQFARGATGGGTIAMLAQWAAQHDLGFSKAQQDRIRALGPNEKPGEPFRFDVPVVPSRPIVPVLPADDFGRDSEVVRSQAKSFNPDPIFRTLQNAVDILNPISKAHSEELRSNALPALEDRLDRVRQSFDTFRAPDDDRASRARAGDASRQSNQLPGDWPGMMERARRSADEFKRDPEGTRGRAMMERSSALLASMQDMHEKAAQEGTTEGLKKARPDAEREVKSWFENVRDWFHTAALNDNGIDVGGAGGAKLMNASYETGGSGGRGFGAARSSSARTGQFFQRQGGGSGGSAGSRSSIGSGGGRLGSGDWALTADQAGRAKESYDFWRSKGLDHNAALGMSAQEGGESKWGDPSQWVGDHGNAIGAYQWDPSRRAAILKGTGIDVEHDHNHQHQLQAAFYDASRIKGYLEHINGLSRSEAVRYGISKFERSKNQGSDQIIRDAYAANMDGGGSFARMQDGGGDSVMGQRTSANQTSIHAGRANFAVGTPFAPNFEGFLKDWQAAGGTIRGGGGYRNTLIAGSNTLSFHAQDGGRAIDINQLSRNRITGGLPGGIAQEEAIAHKWGLRAGSEFSNPDRGHYEVNNPARAQAALDAMAKMHGELNEQHQANRKILETNRNITRGRGLDGGLGAQGDPQGTVNVHLHGGMPAPKQVRTSTEGFFKNVNVNRGRSMGVASEEV